MTLLTAIEALATEVSVCVGLLYSKCLHQEKVTTIMKTSPVCFHHSAVVQSKNACSFSKNEEKRCKGQIKVTLTMTPEL